MEEHCNAEHAKDKVYLPLDVDKGGWDEVAKSKIESPVGRSGQSNSFATDSERVELRWVNSTDWAPSWRIGSNERGSYMR